MGLELLLGLGALAAAGILTVSVLYWARRRRTDALDQAWATATRFEERRSHVERCRAYQQQLTDHGLPRPKKPSREKGR